MKLGVIVGRFQVPELHEGHRRLIEYVKAHHDTVLVLLGVSQVVGSKRNPLDFPTRQKMIQETFSDVLVAPLPDMPTDESWSDNLDSLCRLVCPVGEIRLFGGRDSFIPHYHGQFKTVDVELGFSPSGTAVREIAANKIRISSDFRAGVIYSALNQYQRVFPTVDVAIIRDGQILLGRKKNHDRFCFPGGFVDPRDETLEDAAIREALEETSVFCRSMKYVGSLRSADWRYQHPDDGSIVTSLFVSLSNQNHARANDDLDSLQWFPFHSFPADRLVDAHKPLMMLLHERVQIEKPKGESFSE